ncbi:hypothetical protein GA0074694_4317 [Micromonospora inyonensis]|uniref:Uncharacterized protein n=1 Tax=Micromonospora inyonensis TaxID=47866 RepID=A0A1C6S8E1_9ACTN|nr:hypothetical protein GA0074694_4317 [Micromonospora inyonensis]
MTTGQDNHEGPFPIREGALVGVHASTEVGSRQAVGRARHEAPDPPRPPPRSGQSLTPMTTPFAPAATNGRVRMSENPASRNHIVYSVSE